jgi:hypothetical protein
MDPPLNFAISFILLMATSAFVSLDLFQNAKTRRNFIILYLLLVYHKIAKMPRDVIITHFPDRALYAVVACNTNSAGRWICH